MGNKQTQKQTQNTQNKKTFIIIIIHPSTTLNSMLFCFCFNVLMHVCMYVRMYVCIFVSIIIINNQVQNKIKIVVKILSQKERIYV